MQSSALDTGEFKEMLEAAVDVGFTDFSFTGGEPLLTPQIAERTFELAKFVNNIRTDASKDGYTKLNTNGSNLLHYKDEIVDMNFTELKVSLDTLDAATFRALSKRGDKVLQATIDGILDLKQEVPIRLQTVVGKYNVGQITDILDFCTVNGLDIKLFDISRYDNALSGSSMFADMNYVSLTNLCETLESVYGKPDIKYAVGGYGHPKKVFTTNVGTKIEIRDTSPSAHYSSGLCEDCSHYQCQDGLCNLVIAADGHVRFCREGGIDQTISLRNEAGNLKTPKEIRSDLVRAAGIFDSSQDIERQVVRKPNRLHLPIRVINYT